jgi:GT2 family glycosyltransferase
MNVETVCGNAVTGEGAVKISVVVATFNRRESLKRLLESLFRQSLPPADFEVIVVSDGSTDGTREMVQDLKRSFTNLAILDLKNRGPGAARNAGARLARGQYLAFTDDDCVATPDWLEQLIGSFENTNAVAVQGRTTTDPATRTPLTHQVEVHSAWTSIMPACNAAYRRTAFDAVGGFDETFTFLNEDVDLVWRVEELGKVVFAPAVHIIHPPRRDSFLKRACGDWVFEGEFPLYYKNQAKYRKYKSWSPWWTIYWKVFIVGQFRLAKSSCRYLIHPFKPQYFFAGIGLVTARWFNLIRFFPAYYQAQNLHRRQIPSDDVENSTRRSGNKG